MAEDSTIPPIPQTPAAAAVGNAESGRGLADLAAEHIRSAPAVNAEAVAAEKQKTADLVDASGVKFDSRIHQVDPAGKPVVKADGKFALKRGPKTAIVAAEQQQRALQYQALGTATAETFFVLCVSMGGPDWKPEDEERGQLAEAWGYYFETTGIVSLPPWMVVLCATSIYAGRRFQLPETQTRLARLVGWAVGKFRR